MRDMGRTSSTYSRSVGMSEEGGTYSKTLKVPLWNGRSGIPETHYWSRESQTSFEQDSSI